MNAILIFGGLAVVLFFASLVSKRRFGMLGLALAAGTILSSIWNGTVSLLVSALAFVPNGSFTDTVIKALLVLAPAVLLLFHGVTYKSMAARIFGSLLFAGLAVTFVSVPLASIMGTHGMDKQVTDWLGSNYPALVSLGLVLAVLDLFTTKAQAKHEMPEKKGKH